MSNNNTYKNPSPLNITANQSIRTRYLDNLPQETIRFKPDYYGIKRRVNEAANNDAEK